MSAGDRLSEARNKLKLSQEELGKPLGYAYSKVRDMESGKQKITMEAATGFEDKFSISSSWLLSGSGEMLAPANATKSFDSENDGCRRVDIFNMVSGGPGAEPVWYEPIDCRSIPVNLLKANIRAVLVRGRSMEPTFKNGAIIGVDQSDKRVVSGEAYAVMLDYEGAAVKRLYSLPDGVLIRSDNKEFPEVKLDKEDVPDYFILGRVCWVVQEV